MVRFTHLEEAYRNAAWVRVDGDETGRKIVSDLQTKFPDWDQTHFACFEAQNFENYYPETFSGEIQTALKLQGQQKREAKQALLEQVRAWLDEDEERGKHALAVSASEVIEHLRLIETELLD